MKVAVAQIGREPLGGQTSASVAERRGRALDAMCCETLARKEPDIVAGAAADFEDVDLAAVGGAAKQQQKRADKGRIRIAIELRPCA